MERLGVIKTFKVCLPKKCDTENAHIWYKDCGQYYMFKYLLDDKYDFRTAINEVLISKMCKRLGLPCQDVEFASFHGVKGVRIKSFLAHDEKEIRLLDILNLSTKSKLVDILGKDYFNEIISSQLKKRLKAKGIVQNKAVAKIDPKDALAQIEFMLDCHWGKCACEPQALAQIDAHFEELLKLLEPYNKTLNEAEAMKLINQYAVANELTLDRFLKFTLFQEFILDILVCQNDRHLGNVSVIQTGGKLKIAPLYDNGHCLLYMGKGKQIVHKQVELTEGALHDSGKLMLYERTLYNFKNFINKSGEAFMQEFYEQNKDDIIASLPKSIKNKDEFLKNYLAESLKFMKGRVYLLENMASQNNKKLER